MGRKVGVLLGGMSSEREISLQSGRAVAAALRSRGHDVVEIDVSPDLAFDLRDHNVEVAWIALHGAFGEDGCVQGLLEIMRIPYTGTGVRGSAIAMDKIATKRMLRGSAVQLPADWVWQAGTPLPSDLTYPIVAKTPGGGSTIGVYICDDEKQLVVALDECTKWESTVLLEQKIVGEEITVAILEDQVLPVVAIRPVEGFFDFDAKYTKGQTEYLVPAPISEASSNSAQEQALVAWRTLRLAGIARADFIVDAEGIPWFLEINTIPGMTETSLSPMAAGALGISFEALVERCLLNSQLSVPTE